MDGGVALGGPSEDQRAHHTGQSGDPRPDPELATLRQADEGRASPGMRPSHIEQMKCPSKDN